MSNFLFMTQEIIIKQSIYIKVIFLNFVPLHFGNFWSQGKAQTISKAKFGILNSPKKTNAIHNSMY